MIEQQQKLFKPIIIGVYFKDDVVKSIKKFFRENVVEETEADLFDPSVKPGTEIVKKETTKKEKVDKITSLDQCFKAF